jgi:shikimate dehydrogenase
VFAARGGEECYCSTPHNILKEVYTLDDLQNWRRVSKGVKPPILLGVFGDPVAHSHSPQMQNAALRECKIDAQYARFQIRPNELAEALDLIGKLEFAGVNLTVPHKIAAVDFVDEIDDEAKQIGAVNTIALREGKLMGFNTDGVGFARAIRTEFSVDLRDLRVMLLGAGGAARAIAMQCAQASCERLVVFNRDVDKAKQLVAELQPRFAGPRVLGPVARIEAVPLDERALRFQIGNVDLLVNATPLGLDPNDPPVLPATVLTPHLMVYDTVYSQQGRTALVTAAVEAGARAANGLSMLLYQGARSFEIWFKREAPLDVMRAALAL